MNTSLAQRGNDASIVERVLMDGDLSPLTPEQKVAYYNRVCDSLSLNPLTKPFDFLRLNGKMILYARKDATEQLRKRDGVSIVRLEREISEGVYVVTAYAVDSKGRQDSSVGAVSIEGLKGENRANAMMKAECVPLDSEILTRDGFKTYDRLRIGEEVLAYDIEAGCTRWTPLLAVSKYGTAPVVRLYSDKGQFDVTCTADHSWAAEKGSYKPDRRTDGSRGPKGAYKSRRPDRFLVKTFDIKKSHSLVLAAPETETTESALTPVEAAVLGWAVTDGTIQERGGSRRIGICQSKEENFEAIRELVGVVAGDIPEVVNPARPRTFPSSGRTYETKEQHWWYLPTQVSRNILDRASFESRADLPSLVTRLSSKARQAMLQAMMLAEGDKRGNFYQGDPSVIDTFHILCALEGIATGSLNQRQTIKGIRLKKTRRVAGAFLNTEPAGDRAVWCPTTQYGTWVMRQNGRVMITGNTKAKRRVTLSICGLGFLDETEIDSIPDARPVRVDIETGVIEGETRPVETKPQSTPAEIQAAEYKRLYSKAVDLGLPLTKDGHPLPPAIPPTSGKLAMAVDYLRGMVAQAEQMADAPETQAA